MEIFFEIHKDIPREGPGSDLATAKAYSLIKDLPVNPQILDIGCGPGKQTIQLAKCSNGKIIGIDTHQYFLDSLKKSAERENVLSQIECINASMLEIPYEENSFDVIWSEGAIYIMGFEKGLKEWKKYLKPNGYIAVSELSWIKKDMPEEIKAYWNVEYPDMKSVEENIDIINNLDYELVGHFTLPKSAWTDEYYEPLAKRIEQFRQIYKDNDKVLASLNETEKEIFMLDKYAEYYSYEFYIMKQK